MPTPFPPLGRWHDAIRAGQRPGSRAYFTLPRDVVPMNQRYPDGWLTSG